MPATKVGKIDSEHPQYREGYEWTFVCACGYASFGWPTKKQAELRKEHHLAEHENSAKVRELLDSGDIEGAQKYLMPPREEVEALTPDKFPVTDVKEPGFDDIHGVWDKVS